MIITIDGMDGSGKSSLAQKLAQRLNFKYIDKPIYQVFGVFGDNNILYQPIYQMQDAIYNKTNSDKLKTWFTGMSLLYIKEVLSNQNLVIDRGLLSCYLFNGNHSSTQIFDLLINFGVWFDISIFLYVSPKIRKQRLLKRNPTDPDLYLDKIMNLKYDTISAFLKSNNYLPIITINTDNLTENEVLNLAMFKLKKHFKNSNIF